MLPLYMPGRDLPHSSRVLCALFDEVEVAVNILSRLRVRPQPVRLRDFGAFQVPSGSLPGTSADGRNFNSAFGVWERTPGGLPSVYEQQVDRRRFDPVHVLSNSDRKASVLKWLRTVVGLGLICSFLIYTVRSVSLPVLIATLAHIQVADLLIALVIGFTCITLSALQWHSLLRAERIQLDLAYLVNIYIIGVAFNHFLPVGVGGDVIKARYVGRAAHNQTGSTSAVVLCRVAGFLAMLLIMVPSLVVWHDAFTANTLFLICILCLLICILLAGLFCAVIWLPNAIGPRWTQNHVFIWFSELGRALLLHIKHPRAFALAIIYGIVFWIVAILNCYCYANALGIRAPLVFYCVTVPLVALVSSLPISINGFGLREGTYVYVFSTLHVPPALALSVALLLDLQAFIFACIGGCIYLSRYGK